MTQYAIGSRLKLRLFLEGIEVPVIAAQIQSAANGPSTCTLQIPPLEEGKKLLPRTLVHLFFYDYAESASSLVSLHGESRTSRIYNDPTTYERQRKLYDNQETPSEDPREYSDVTAEELEKDTRNDKFKLAFCGEVYGFSWTKTPANRSLVLQCVDLSNYWDYAYQFEGGDIFGPGAKALFSGGGTNLFTDFLESKSGVIISILRTPSKNYPGIKGIAGGLIHLVEAIGGYYYSSSDGRKRDTFAGQNIFFSLAELRLHFTQMVHAYNQDDSAWKLLGGGSYDGLFGRTLGGLGSQVSIRQAINAVGGAIFYETYSIPSPMYVPGTRGEISGYTRYVLRESPNPKAKTIKAFVEDTISFLWDVSHRVIKNELTTPKIKDIAESLENTVKTLQKLIADAQKNGFRLLIQHFTKAIFKLNQAKMNLLGVQGQFMVKQRDKAAERADTLIDQAINDLENALGEQVYQTPATEARPAKLIQQIFRPDTWFAAPPRCNVIFPDQYTQVSYTRNYLSEPTRLLLKTHDEFFGEDELFDNFYYAPMAPNPKGQRATLQKMLQNNILKHEIYTGILPVFEKLGEFSIFGIRSGQAKGKNPKVGLAQRSANFLYFRSRFASRQLNVQSLFLPYLVPGFPAFVIDRQSPYFVVNDFWQAYHKYKNFTPKAVYDTLGSHHLGQVAQIEHSLSQMNGTTSVICTYARTTDETVEFLGSIDPDKDQVVQQRFNKDVFRSTQVASIVPPVVGELGPNNGIITKAADVTDIVRLGSNLGKNVGILDPNTDEPVYPIYKGGRRSGLQESKDLKVPVGTPIIPKDWNPRLAQALNVSDDQPVLFRLYEVREEVPSYRQTKVDLPPEELIRPGWFGDCWHPNKIGEVYEAFFRTGSITDPQQAVDADGAMQRSTDSDADDVLAEKATYGEADDLRRITAPAVLALDKDSSIGQACAFILLLYSYIKNQKLDVKSFIDSYNWRPIASIVDMFGTSDLTYSDGGEEVVFGLEGFHSKAFGPYENLFGLVDPNIKTILGISENDVDAATLDTRLEKWNRVMSYVYYLTGKNYLG